jgi:hypothetical protein
MVRQKAVPGQRIKPPSGGNQRREVRTEANTVDVRGLRVHEAEAAVEGVRQLYRLPPAGQLGAQPRCFP